MPIDKPKRLGYHIFMKGEKNMTTEIKKCWNCGGNCPQKPEAIDSCMSKEEYEAEQENAAYAESL